MSREIALYCNKRLCRHDHRTANSYLKNLKEQMKYQKTRQYYKMGDGEG